jgi:hypothetical protein
MLRTVWLGLGCLICISGLFALKISLAISTKLETPVNDPNIIASMDFGAAPKADRLEVSYVDDAPGKIFVKPIVVVPLKADASPSENVATAQSTTPSEKTVKIVGRHWHERYAKMNRQSAHKLRVATRTRSRS